MDKATRVLTLLTRLINGDVVRPFEFNDITGISSKTLQRDITELNTFFYESDYWNNKETKVIYSRSLEGYTLINGSYSKSSLGVLSLLIKIKSLTPILHNDVYNVLLNEISYNRVEDKYILKSVLEHFKIRSGHLPGRNLMKLQESITKQLKTRIEIEDKIIVKPLSLMYMHYDYWLTYEQGGIIKNIKVRDIKSIRLLESKFEKVNNEKPITFEVDLSIWNQFKQQFSIKEILNRENSKITVIVSCTELDAYYIAYQLAPLATIISPQNYIDNFIKRLESIKSIYKK
ncbi:hypothetical protein HYE69_01820 [Staphylococcus sp. GSSP0090]|nr:hypothetical protein [Staphylococcus sp. GSSP0090]